MRFSILAALLLLARGAAAQDAAPLTLEEAVARALERNPAVKAAVAAGDEAGARARGARAGYYPRVDFVEAWQRGNQPVYVFGSLLAQRRFTAADFALDALNHPDALTNHRAGIVIAQPIFDGWQTRASVTLARLDVDAASLERRATAARLKVDVVTAFARAVSTRTMQAAAAAAVATAREDVRRAEARRDLGVETEANVLAFRVHLADREAQLVRTEADAAVARATLNGLMADPLADARPLSVPASLPSLSIDEAALEDEALTSRPDVLQARLRQDAAAAARTRARAGLLPQVFVQGSAEANGHTFADRASSWGAGVEVRWNLFAGGGDSARTAEAGAAARRAAAERERVETAVRLDVRSAIAAYRSAAARERATRDTAAQARESQRMIRDRYEAGLASAGDVLRAAELLAQAETARTGALVDVHVSAAALERAVGRPGSQQ